MKGGKKISLDKNRLQSMHCEEFRYFVLKFRLSGNSKVTLNIHISLLMDSCAGFSALSEKPKKKKKLK